jgi:serine/threonine protein kinase
LLGPDGRLSINDFGLARVLEQPGMTMNGEFVGTPRYMSPESNPNLNSTSINCYAKMVLKYLPLIGSLIGPHAGCWAWMNNPSHCPN